MNFSEVDPIFLFLTDNSTNDSMIAHAGKYFSVH
jgi:hypothetical protein